MVRASHWLERLTGHQKFAGSISVLGSEIVFLGYEHHKRLSAFQNTSVVA